MPDEPTIASVLRDAAFEDISEKAALAESYARSLGEAAYRGSRIATAVHTDELRLVCIAIIKTFNDYLRDKPHGEGVAEAGSSRPDRAGEQAGDGVGRDQPQAAA